MAKKARAPQLAKSTARQGLLSSQLSPGAIAAANAKHMARNGDAFHSDRADTKSLRDESVKSMPARLLLARIAGSRNPAFKSIPAHNQVKMQAIMGHTEAADSIFLGISADGLCLYSYSFEQVLQGRVSFSFQIWQLKNQSVPFVGDMSRSYSIHALSPYMQLLGTYPLFADNNWASAGLGLSGDAVRLNLWESPDQRCIVTVGTLHERGMHGPQPCHISIIPYPVLPPSSSAWQALSLARPLAPTGSGSAGAAEPSSAVLHVTVVISSPYPSPSIVGFQCIPSSSPLYRLVLSTGDGQCCCEWRVRCLAVPPKEAALECSSPTDGTMAALHSARYSLPDLQAAQSSPWFTRRTHGHGGHGSEQQAEGAGQGRGIDPSTQQIEQAAQEVPLCAVGVHDDAIVDSWLQEPQLVAAAPVALPSGIDASAGASSSLPRTVFQEVHTRADGTVSLEAGIAVLSDVYDPRSVLGAPFLHAVRAVDGEQLVAAALAAQGYPARVVRNFDCRLVCLLEQGRAARLMKTAAVSLPLSSSAHPCLCTSVPPAVQGEEGEGSPLCVAQGEARQVPGQDFMILCCLVDYEDVLASDGPPVPPTLPLGPTPSSLGVNAQPALLPLATQAGKGQGTARTYGKDRSSTGSSKSSGARSSSGGAGEKRGREEGWEERPHAAMEEQEGQSESSSSLNASGEDAWALVEPASTSTSGGSEGASTSPASASVWQQDGEDGHTARRATVAAGEGASSCSTTASGSSSLVSDSTSAQRCGWHSQQQHPSRRSCRVSHGQLQPVAKHGPLVRDELLLAISLTTGCQHLIRHTRLAPSQQPAFDSREGGGGTLTRLTSSCVNALRVLPALRPRPGTLARELTNDSVLAGQSLPALVNPLLPMALVL